MIRIKMTEQNKRMLIELNKENPDRERTFVIKTE